MAFYSLITILLLQRLGELIIGQKNLRKIRKDALVPLPPNKKTYMLLLHTLFFVSCLLEFTLRGGIPPSPWFSLGMLALALCQFVRLKSMRLLREYWTPWPLAFKGQPIIHQGPYKWARHPNYLIVIVEMFLIPLLGKCYLTALIFGPLNCLFIWRRIGLEEKALRLLPDYEKIFASN